MRQLRFGVDVGGTFTDVFAYDETSGELSSLKVPTEAENQAWSVSAGLRGLLQPGDATGGVVHGTTVVTNAILSPSASPGGRSPDDAATGPDGAAASAGLGVNPGGAPSRLPTVSSGGLLPFSAMLPPADLSEFLAEGARSPPQPVPASCRNRSYIRAGLSGETL